MTAESLEGSEHIAWQVMIDRLQVALDDTLRCRKLALSEYDLIKRLSKSPYAIFAEDALKEKLDLFQTHFILFHALYGLREEWRRVHGEWLEISPLKIALGQNNVPENRTPGPKSAANLPLPVDPIADYYGDLGNLFNTGEKQVEQLLNQFWQQYLHPQQKLSALKTLECASNDQASKIKAQYRKLVMQHHPDRQGDKDSFLDIQEAYEVLKLYYSL